MYSGIIRLWHLLSAVSREVVSGGQINDGNNIWRSVNCIEIPINNYKLCNRHGLWKTSEKMSFYLKALVNL